MKQVNKILPNNKYNRMEIIDKFEEYILDNMTLSICPIVIENYIICKIKINLIRNISEENMLNKNSEFISTIKIQNNNGCILGDFHLLKKVKITKKSILGKLFGLYINKIIKSQIAVIIFGSKS